MKKIVTIFLVILTAGSLFAATPRPTARPGAPVHVSTHMQAQAELARSTGQAQGIMPISADLSRNAVDTVNGAEITAVPIGANGAGISNAIGVSDLAIMSINRSRALQACSSLDEGMRSLLILAGVSTATSVLGMGTGTAGAVTGIMQINEDKAQIGRLGNQVVGATRDRLIRFECSIDGASSGNQCPSTGPTMANMTAALAAQQMSDIQFFDVLNDPVRFPDGTDGDENRVRYIVQNTDGLSYVSERAQSLGVASTVTTFVSGGMNAVAAGSAIAARATTDFDQIRQDMTDCENFARSLTDDPNVMRACQGFNVQNIDVIRNNLAIAGVVSVLGTAAGVVGGIRSIAANNIIPGDGVNGGEAQVKQAQEQRLSSQNQSNAFAIGSAVAGLASGLITGVPLINLQRNARIASDCLRALESGR